MLAGPLALLILAQGHGIAGWVPLLYAALPLLAGVGTEAWSPAMIVAVGAALIMLNGTVPLTGSKALWAMPALAAVATQAFALRYARRNLQRVSLRTLLRSLALQCALAAVLLAAGSWLLDPSPRLAPLAQWNVFSAFSLSLLAIFGTALAYAGLYALLARGTLQPRQIAATQWLQVLVFFAESAFFARVRPPWLSLGAAAILVACCWSVLQASPEVDSKPITLRDTSLD
jgi:drug/metabolite transporter (DMT)-like permease